MDCEQKVTNKEMLKASVGSLRHRIKNIMSVSSNCIIKGRILRSTKRDL